VGDDAADNRVLLELTRHAGGIAAKTAVALRTTTSNQDKNKGQGSAIFSDWLDTREQTAVLTALFSGLGHAKVAAVPKRGAPHFRELRLRWPDGKAVVVRLDHGLSFLRAQGFSPWRFYEPAERQAAAIRGLTLLVRQEAGSIVPLYLSGPM